MALLRAKVELKPSAMTRAKRLLRGAAERVHAHRATVGIHETEGAATKVDYYGKASTSTLVDVAAYHELVGGRIFLRTWFDGNLDQLRREMTAAMRAEYEGEKEAVAEQTAKWAEQLRAWISTQAGQLAELGSRTVDEKTRAGLAHPGVPLLATGQLLAAIRAFLDGAYA